MPIDIDALLKLAAPVVVALIGVIAKQFDARPKLIFYYVHSGALPIPPNGENPNPGNLHTHTIVVRNNGRKSAINVRIDHQIFPLTYRLDPPVFHTVQYGAAPSAEINIPVLVPGEQVSVSYLYLPPLTVDQIGAWVKSNEGMARRVNVIPSSLPRKPVRVLLWSLAFVGASTIVYWLFKVAQLMLQP